MRGRPSGQFFTRVAKAVRRDDEATETVSESDEGELRNGASSGNGISRRTAMASMAAAAGGGMAVLGASAQTDNEGLTVTGTLETDDDLADLTPVELADALLPTDEETGIELLEESVEYTGAGAAAGVFEGEIRSSETATPGPGDRETFGFEDGIILSTGRVQDVEGPNEESDTTTDFGEPGDEDLEALEGVEVTNNAAVLEFEFNVPDGTETVGFNYLFGSVEYNSFVFGINDVFAFFVNGTSPEDNVARSSVGDC